MELRSNVTRDLRGNYDVDVCRRRPSRIFGLNSLARNTTPVVHCFVSCPDPFPPAIEQAYFEQCRSVQLAIFHLDGPCDRRPPSSSRRAWKALYKVWKIALD